MPDFHDMNHLANLARLAPTKESLELFGGQCKKILQYMDSLQKVDTSSIEPMYTPFEEQGTMRADLVEQLETQEDILINSPADNIEYFVVPRIL